ncbi:MAG TPA: hypothetical protein VI306_00170 [Pyrinomonadaceae bacterium]
MAYSKITTDVEQLMARVQSRIDAHPDSRPLFDSIQDCRLHAERVCELTPFSDNLISRTKSTVYKYLMRALAGNFERQRSFNQAVVNTLEIMAHDLDEIRRRLP